MECIDLIKNKMDFICKNTFNFKNDSFKSLTIILTKNNLKKSSAKYSLTLTLSFRNGQIWNTY